MSVKTIVKHCSPTLAGLKTGNLFSVPYEDRKQIDEEIRAFNRLLRKKGLRLLPVQYKGGRVQLYVYRPDRLSKDLNSGEARKILKEKGYDCKTTERCLVRLVRRFREEKEFPHEIGLFLGYPPEDVKGFMNSTRCNVKCAGCWKVYGNREEAEKTFRKFTHCTDIYCKCVDLGRPLEKLIVPVK